MRHFALRFAAAAALASSIHLAPASASDDHYQSGHAEHEHENATVAGDIEITGAWARAMLPNQPTGGGYVTITNTDDEADRLVGVSSPAAARVEIHTMEVVDDVMTMRPVEGGLNLAPGEAVKLAPGGMHLMFMQVTEPFREGYTVPVTLKFEKAGEVEIDLPVRAASGGSNHEH